jgi:hypothetical protein
MRSLRSNPQFHLAALRQTAQTHALKGWFHMGDLISIGVGVLFFALLFLYVPVCQKV